MAGRSVTSDGGRKCPTCNAELCGPIGPKEQRIRERNTLKTCWSCGQEGCGLCMVEAVHRGGAWCHDAVHGDCVSQHQEQERQRAQDKRARAQKSAPRQRGVLYADTHAAG